MLGDVEAVGVGDPSVDGVHVDQVDLTRPRRMPHCLKSRERKYHHVEDSIKQHVESGLHCRAKTQFSFKVDIRAYIYPFKICFKGKI